MAIDIKTQELFPVRRDKQVSSSSGTISYGSGGSGVTPLSSPNVTVSTLPPSGTPANNDEWIMYIA